MPDRLGSIGTRLDIDVRIGDSFGPFDFTECTDESGALVDFTGSTWECIVSKRDGSNAAAISPSVVAVALGHFRINRTATSALTGGTFFEASPAYNWKLRRTDAAGTVGTDLFGVILVAAEDVE